MKVCPKCQKQFSDDANFCPVDAARLAPLEAQGGGADALTSRFDLGPRLGGTRTGAVHRAVEKTTGRPCAIKLVSPAVVGLAGVSQRLDRELKQLERVQSAGVAKVVASGKRGDETWVAVELLDGAHTLAEAIGARGPIPSDNAADLIEVIGEALIEAAQVGVVHRDLAPKNVLFAGQEVKLINFSLPVPTDKVPGVPEFVAPEQMDGRPVDQRSNLYSLGALYYYVLTGTPPQHDGNGAIRPPSQLVAVPPQVDAVIVRALERSPTKRFLTVRQFVDEVMRVGHGDVIELKKTTPDGRSARPKGELVQTLMGINRSGGSPLPSPSNAPTQAPMQGYAMQQPAPPVVAPAPAPRAQSNPLSQTVMGVPSMGMHAGPAQPAPQMMQPPPATAQMAPSPWAAPGSAAAQPAPAMPQPVQARAASQPAPPVVAAPAAPVVAAPQVAAAAQGRRKGPDEVKGKFRETMWFKKGDLDAQAAQAAAEERARTGKVVDQDKADSLPMDERYKDDGSITRGDKEKYSLRTGATMMMQSVPEGRAGERGSKVSEDALIGEMKGGRAWVILLILVGLGAIGGIIYLIVK
jgi:serine/threonine protein kinase